MLPFLLGLILILLPVNPIRQKNSQLVSITKAVEQQLSLIEEDSKSLIRAAKEDSIDFSLVLRAQHYPFVIYKKEKLVYWNNYKVVPAYRYVSGDYDIQFLRLPGGQYIGRKWTIGDYEILGLIWLYNNYRIDNKYVSSGYNEEIFSFNPERLLEPSFDTGYEICVKDNCLFQIAFQSSNLIPEVIDRERWGTLLLLFSYLAAIWLVFLNRKVIFNKWGFGLGSLLITAFMVAPRFLMLAINFPRQYFNFPLFDTTAFASSWLNPTLGDLLLNFIIILFLVLLFFEFRAVILRKVEQSRFKISLAVIIALAYFYFGLLLFLLIQTVYNNSHIRIDITQSLSFDWLSIAFYLILLIASTISFLTGHVVVNLLDQVLKKTREKVAIAGIGFLIFIVIAVVENTNYIIPICISAAILFILLYTQLYKSLSKVRFATYIYIFSWAVASSLTIAYATMKLEEKKEYESQVKFAEKFLVESDAFAEYLLHEVNQKIASDLFIQSMLLSPYLGKDVVKEKVRQVYMSGYFDKYDIKIYLFDSQGRPYDPRDFMLRPSDVRINNSQYQTDHRNIYYIDNPDDELAGRYLNIIEVKKRGLRVGYILLDLQLKKIIPENVYPELLVDHRFLQPFQNKSYSYALFSEGSIGYSAGDFNYESEFNQELLSKRDSTIYEQGIVKSGYQHKAIINPEGQVYVISVPAHNTRHFFSNFSFFFLLIVFVVMVISLIYAIFYMIRGSELYYSARIQLYLSLSFFIPMLIVTIITLSLVSRTFKEEVNREYEKKAENMAGIIANDVGELSVESQLINVLLRASRYANADANIFSPEGELMATSQPMIFENHLLAPYINPLAYISIVGRNKKMFTANEAVGALDFNTTYYSIKSPESGEFLGILSVPYFESEAALERNEINIFTSIISIFTLLFLVFLVISYLASEYLTFPLKIITRKLQKTSLEFNEPLSWEARDEIGLMVREYNKMLINLEESKKALARTEKESAWREMAQQVAHEIKNPLTPMKLTLQHLQRRLTDGKENEQFKKSINTLLHQVDTLSEIAGSFSNFAKMPAPTKEQFDLQKLIQKSISLFSNTEGIKLIYDGADRDLIIEADEQLMGRIFSNILINAIEAGEGYHPLLIKIKTELTPDDQVRVSIADNGPGIETNVREKIFIPHFSTKKTGSGIGLAIARRGVEHAGGEIWFETEEGKGTKFFILLPLVNA